MSDDNVTIIPAETWDDFVAWLDDDSPPPPELVALFSRVRGFPIKE